MISITDVTPGKALLAQKHELAILVTTTYLKQNGCRHSVIVGHMDYHTRWQWSPLNDNANPVFCLLNPLNLAVWNRR